MSERTTSEPLITVNEAIIAECERRAAKLERERALQFHVELRMDQELRNAWAVLSEVDKVHVKRTYALAAFAFLLMAIGALGLAPIAGAVRYDETDFYALGGWLFGIPFVMYYTCCCATAIVDRRWSAKWKALLIFSWTVADTGFLGASVAFSTFTGMLLGTVILFA